MRVLLKQKKEKVGNTVMQKVCDKRRMHKLRCMHYDVEMKTKV